MRKEMIAAIAHGEESITAIAKRYAIARTTLYKWKRRDESEGAKGLEDRSRRPHRADKLWTKGVSKKIIRLRKKHPKLGCRKIRAILKKRKRFFASE